MRRLVFIVLMLVLPLQWTWAAAASHCDHEEQGAHFGHHEHKHACSDDGTADKAGAGQSSAHADCQVCHGAGAACIASLDVDRSHWNGRAPLPSFDGHLPEPPVESLLRPPLNLVA